MTDMPPGRGADIFTVIMSNAGDSNRETLRRPRISVDFVPDPPAYPGARKASKVSAYSTQQDHGSGSPSLNPGTAGYTTTMYNQHKRIYDAQLQVGDILVVLRALVDKTQTSRELRQIRVTFAKGFHPDRCALYNDLNCDTLMREANAMIDTAIKTRRF
ncbi:MAG: hypothetical protein ACK4MV_10730 [Beijerinckiaceae bacterium]